MKLLAAAPSELARPLGVGAAALISAGYVAAVDPNVAGHYPGCPLLAVTGWFCPGCGGLRAAHALAHGDVLTALARNPFAVVAMGYLVVVWTLWLQRTVTGRPQRPSPLAGHRLAPYCLFAVILAFWILRNLPGWTWLSPA